MRKLDWQTLPYQVKDLAVWMGIGFVVLAALLAFFFLGENQPPEADDVLSQPAVISAKEDATERFDASPKNIETIEVEEVTFTDTCLNAPREDEVCAQVMTEGYRVVIKVNNRNHVYHTDITGNLIRFVR